jgi:hypothetical protein
MLYITMPSGHILWLSHGKRERAVYDFIDHVGEKWTDRVETVACDMHSDFRSLRGTLSAYPGGVRLFLYCQGFQ